MLASTCSLEAEGKKKYIACWLARCHGLRPFDSKCLSIYWSLSIPINARGHHSVTQCRSKFITPIDTSLFVHAMMLMLECTFSERVLSERCCFWKGSIVRPVRSISSRCIGEDDHRCRYLFPVFASWMGIPALLFLGSDDLTPLPFMP
jgi:hypothetical protein